MPFLEMCGLALFLFALTVRGNTRKIPIVKLTTVRQVKFCNFFSFNGPSRVLFGHVTRWTGESASFTNRYLSWVDMVVHLSTASIWTLLPLYSRPDKSKRFPPFCCMVFSVRSLNPYDSCVAEGGNWVPFSYWVQLNVLLY